MISHSYSCIARTIVLWLTALVPLTSAFSQNQRVIDSLLTVLPNKTGAEKYAVYHKLTAEYADWDNEMAFEFAKSAERVAVALADSLLMVRSQRLKAQILFRLGRPQDIISSLNVFVNSPNSKKYGSEYLAMINLMGVSHAVMSHFDEALSYYFETYRLAQELKDEEYLPVSLENIGVSYYKLKNYAKGLSFMLQSLALRKRFGKDTLFLAMNVSLCYAQLKNFDKAREYLDQCSKICEAGCSPAAMVHLKYASGFNFFGLGRYHEAEAEFLQSLAFSREVEDYRMQLDNIYILAKIYIASNNLRKAERLLDDGEHIIRSGTPYNLEIIKVYSQLSELYSEMKNFRQASRYQSRYIHLKDSIYNEALMTSLMEVESKHLEHENEARIAEQLGDISSKQQVIHRQLIFNLMIGSLALMSLAVIALLFRVNRSKRLNNRLLQKKVMERTSQLEAMLAEMERVVQEKNLQQQKILELISKTTKSLEGLCIAGSREICDDLSKAYFKKIETTLTCLKQ